MIDCLSCKSRSMKESRTTYFTQLKNCYVIIENVPCIKCGQCGDVLYNTDDLEKIESILDSIQQISSEITVTVINYSDKVA